MPENEHGDTSVLTTLFAHNTWANLKLLDFCEKLSDAQRDATAIGGFGSGSLGVAVENIRSLASF